MGKIISFFVAFVLLILMGFILKRQKISKVVSRFKYTLDYYKNFVELLNEVFQSKRINQEKYIWLTEKVNAMQRELGDSGIMHYYSDPLQGFTAKEYQLLINFLPEISSYIHEFDNSIMLERFNSSARWCTDMFIRHQGDLKEMIENENKILYNPLSCFAEAIRCIVALPFSILYWLGILSEGMLYRIKHSWFLKFVNAIVILIGLIGSIITISLGWDGFQKLLNNYF
ncbi:MAG: hypothetical protein P4L35_12810 [Ignavibacteriaceae bacterium]|nr:hypothetical protein [Ignavibacteriaceae bacterium]